MADTGRSSSEEWYNRRHQAAEFDAGISAASPYNTNTNDVYLAVRAPGSPYVMRNKANVSNIC